MTYIYILKDPITQEIRYVGKADNPHKRLKKHLYNCNQGTNHKNNWIKVLKSKGVVPILDIIEEVEDSQWKYKEIYWIKYYKSIGCILVNSTVGGEGCKSPSSEVRDKIVKSLSGRKHTQKTKDKISKSALGNTRNRGKKHTQERIDKWRKTRQGWGHTEETKKRLSIIVSEPVIQIEISSGKIVNIYSSAKKASEIMKVKQSAITNAVNGWSQSSCGYKWEKYSYKNPQHGQYIEVNQNHSQTP